MHETTKNMGMDHLSLMNKRIKFLIGARVQDRDKMLEAAKSIDKLRRKVENWNGTEEIRKWRDTR